MRENNKWGNIIKDNNFMITCHNCCRLSRLNAKTKWIHFHNWYIWLLLFKNKLVSCFEQCECFNLNTFVLYKSGLSVVEMDPFNFWIQSTQPVTQVGLSLTKRKKSSYFTLFLMSRGNLAHLYLRNKACLIKQQQIKYFIWEWADLGKLYIIIYWAFFILIMHRLQPIEFHCFCEIVQNNKTNILF